MARAAGITRWGSPSKMTRTDVAADLGAPAELPPLPVLAGGSAGMTAASAVSDEEGGRLAPTDMHVRNELFTPWY